MKSPSASKERGPETPASLTSRPHRTCQTASTIFHPTRSARCIGRCCCRGGSTTRNFSSSTRASSSSRSAAPATKRFSSRPASSSNRATTGSFPTIATARCAWRSASRRYEMFLAGVGAERRPGQRRASDAVALGQPPAQHRLAVQRHRHAVRAGDRLRRRRTPLRAHPRTSRIARRSFERDEVVYVSLGDGSTSEGEFWESLNTACLCKLPVLFLIEDNGYAISVPVDAQTAGGDHLAARRDVSRPETRPRATAPTCSRATRAVSEAVAWCRARKGPRLVHAKVIRPYSHSHSDDERLYKTAGGAGRGSHARSDSEIRGVPEDATA